jgi:DNA-binding transcriptional LysR family regulator
MLDRKFLYAIATFHTGSFTAAAKRVGVSQPAITKGVSELERQLGFAIFNRTGRGVMLTEQGRAFIEPAARLLNEAQELLRGSLAGTDPYSDTLRIGICPASIEWFFIKPLLTLMSRHPSIRLDIISSSYERIVQRLRSAEIDIALGYDAAFNDQPDFRRDPLLPIEAGFFVRKNHPLLCCDKISINEFSKYDMIIPSDSPPYSHIFREIYERAEVDAKTKMHFIDYFPLASRLVANSDAMGIVSRRFAETATFQSIFIYIPFGAASAVPATPAIPLCIATRRRWNHRPAVRAFIKACRELMLAPDHDLHLPD